METNIIKKNFILKKYDENLISFIIEKRELDDYKITICSITNNESDLPNGVKDSETLLNWLRKRSIPKNRAFVLEILKNQNIEPNDLIELLSISKGLSLNDVYWVVESDFKGSFNEYNLFENDFSEILSLIAYTGEYNNSKDSPLSPEWTTSGNLPKCWRREHGKLYLYKAGTSINVLVNREGYEPYSEYYVSEMLDYLNIKHVKYDLSMFKGRVASVCECFCDLNNSYVPMGNIIQNNNYSDLKKFIIENKFEEDFSNMILIDALTYNVDRHFNNFGVIKDNKTNKIIKLAPIYDNGLSLFSNLSDYLIEDSTKLDDEIKVASISKWNISHNKLLLDNLDEDTYRKLIKLKNYKIQKHSKYNLSDRRINILTNVINKRIDELIDLLIHK